MKSVWRTFNAVNLFSPFKTQYRKCTILGIETSCDDTGVGIVLNNGGRNFILGDKILSQQNMHNRYGGIIPPVAQNYHRESIQLAVDQCLKEANITLDYIDFIAVTTRPGLPMSLSIGLRYAKYLCRRFGKPLIPIHHMEAHALMVRLEQNIPFPFMSLLISGGHCQLLLVHNPSNFTLIGETLDESPGETFDKLFRRLKLKTLNDFKDISGGRAIELAANHKNGFNLYGFAAPLMQQQDCRFSFAGVKNNAIRLIDEIEALSKAKPDDVLPVYKQICQALLTASTAHICHKLRLGIEYCLKHQFLSNRIGLRLVISGGVAANDVIFSECSNLASNFGFKTFRPSKRFCSDNGVMIAWNGIEKILFETNASFELKDVHASGKCTPI